MASKRIPPNVVIRGSKAAPPPTATVILMHGLGDTADGWVDAAEFMARSLPHVQFVLPTATKEPVTVNGNMHMPSWYDIETLGTAKLDRTHEGECKGIEFSRDRILGLVEESVKAGIPYSRIVLSGFSQGGSLALHIATHTDKPLAGVLSMSGYFPKPPASSPLAEKAPETPILLLHGREDEVLPVDCAHDAKAHCERLGFKKVEMTVYPRLGHSVHMQELREAASFLSKVLPPLDVAPSASGAASAAPVTADGSLA